MAVMSTAMQQHWKNIERIERGKGTSDLELENLKRSWFGGAIVMFQVVHELGVRPGTSKQIEAEYRSVAEELKAALALQAARRKPAGPTH